MKVMLNQQKRQYNYEDFNILLITRPVLCWPSKERKMGPCRPRPLDIRRRACMRSGTEFNDVISREVLYKTNNEYCYHSLSVYPRIQNLNITQVSLW